MIKKIKIIKKVSQEGQHTPDKNINNTSVFAPIFHNLNYAQILFRKVSKTVLVSTSPWQR